jgi:hypothetical protein
MLTFEFLIMEVTPDGPGINIIDTDLEVSSTFGEPLRQKAYLNGLGRLCGPERICRTNSSGASTDSDNGRQAKDRHQFP